MCSPIYKGHTDLTSSFISAQYFNGMLFYIIIIKIIVNKKQGLRPLKQLTKHFTTRTDDSHATPVQIKIKNKQIFYIFL